MTKNYVLTCFIILVFALAPRGYSQDIALNNPEQKIENLSIYPNPVNNDRNIVFITSKNNTTKRVEFYNAIGKRLFVTTIRGKELNISKLSTGVYFLKITEKNISETRKLVIN